MFSSSSDVSIVELLDSCSGIDQSTPNYSGATKSITASTPKIVKVSKKESSDLSTPSPSSNILPSLPLKQPSASALTPVTHNLCSKRKVLFSEEDYGENTPASKARLPDHLPFPDHFSIRVEEAIALNQVLSVRKQLISDIGAFYFALSKHPLQGDYKRMALRICDKFPDLRDSCPSSYWVCFVILCLLLFKINLYQQSNQNYTSF